VRVGFLHPGGRVGDRVRIDAIRGFFQAQGIPFREFPMAPPAPSVDIVAQALSWTGVRHLSRKLLRDRAYPVLKELHWSLEARRSEEAAAALASRLRREAADVDVFQAEGLTEGIACLDLLQARGIPFVLDMHGIAAEEARLSGSRDWASWCRRTEQAVVSAARDVLVVSPLSRDYVHRAYGKALERIHVVPNGSEPDERPPAAFRSPLTVVYAGNLAPYENVMEFVRLAELGAAEGLRFWMLGDGVLREPLLDYVNSRGVEIVYFGRKARAAALQRCSRAQVGFAGQSGALDLERDHPRQLACPIKLFDYASCGLPLVAPRGEWSAILEEADCGVIVEACEAPAYLEALRQLDDPAVWSRKARNGLELVRSRFRWSRVLEPLKALYAGT
jgi:glycosyltransferase involved in cell wall biosynthesis